MNENRVVENSSYSVVDTLSLISEAPTIEMMPDPDDSSLFTPQLQSKMMQLSRTNRAWSDYAKEIGFVNNVFDTSDELFDSSMELAQEISRNSPLIIKGVKMILDKGEELTTDQSLDLVRMWSTSFLVSEDLQEGISALMEKREPKFKGK